MNVTAPQNSALSKTLGYSKINGWLRTNHAHDIAILHSETRLTYSELVDAVLSRAKEFKEAGLEKRIVALQRKKSPSYVVDLLALFSIGAVAMPVDPSLPDARRAEMVKISESSFLITEEGKITPQSISALPATELLPDEAAYIFFTSGSTGYPKAILGSDRALRNFIKWQGSEFKIKTTDRIPFLTNIGFDVSLRDILLPLHHGAVLLIPDEKIEEKPQTILAWMKNNDATRLHSVPSVARIWSQCGADPIPTLQTVFSAGEKLTSKTLSAIRDISHSNVEVVNLYGPTETTLAKFFYRLNPKGLVNGPSAPIGQPLPGTSYKLSAENEIILNTPDASLGYLGASSAENARFKTENGITTYETGDIGEIGDDGALYIVGRSDDQVKINGVRLHIKEVEHILSQAPMVDDVVVLPLQTGTGEELRLAVVWTGADVASNAPRSFALESLSRPTVPTIWHRWEELPVNSNGKTDRRTIANTLISEEEPADHEGNYSSTEKGLCQTVEELLKDGPVKITDDFFAIGGTSLHVAFLLGKIEEAHHKALAFSDIFEKSKLTAVAKAIDAAPKNLKPEIPTIGSSDHYALSPQQRRWWNIYMPFGNRSWATMVRMISFDKTVSERKLREALLDLTASQVSMQLSLHPTDNEIVQKRTLPRTPDQMPVSVHDLSTISSDDAGKELDRLRLECANSEITTDFWPLFRCLLVKMPNDKTTLIFAMHHMVSDGFSMGLIETALRASLTVAEKNEASFDFDYLDYAAWAKKQEPVRFGVGSEAERYWRGVFSTPYSKHIFREKWTGPNSDRGQDYCCEVPYSLRSDIQRFARDQRVTDFGVYFSAKFWAWHRLLNRDDLVIGTPAAGRDIAGTDNLVGNFISLCCIRSQLSSAPRNAADYVRNIMQAVASGMTHQGYQYDTLVRALDMEFEQDRFPLTTLFISYLNFEAMKQTPLNRSELGFSDLGFAVKFDVMSYVREHEDCASLQIQYRNNLFEKDEITEFADLWLDEITKITNNQIAN